MVVLPSVMPKIGWKQVVMIVVVVPLAVFVFKWATRAVPGRWTYFNWGASEYLVLGGLLVPVAIGFIKFARRQQRRRLTKLFDAWLSEAPRSIAERSAADFYLSLLRPGRKARGDAVVAYLAVVPPQAGRIIQIGGGPIAPADDGTLWEECDVLEGRMRGSRNWLLFALCVPLVIQLGVFAALAGVNPLRWSGSVLLMTMPTLLNVAVVLLVAGYVRLPGTVVLATPNTVRHSVLKGSLEFTTDDSVLLLSGLDRARALVLYRRDGRKVVVQFPGAAAVGLQNLINRWCMTPAQCAQAPAPATESAS